MGEYSFTLTECFGNSGICCLACFAHQFLAGMNAQALNLPDPTLWALGMFVAPCLVGAYIRGEIRKKHGIEGSFQQDCVLYACFTNCAVAQDAMQIGSFDAFLEEPTAQTIERSSS